MWRSSRSFSSKLLSFSPTNPNATLPTFSAIHAFRTGIFSHLPSQLLHSSPSGIPPSVDPLIPALGKFETGRCLVFSFSAASPAAILGPPASFAAAADAVRHYGRCYWELSKARLSMLVVATSGAGFVLGSGSIIDFSGLCWTCAGTMMVAASANSLNQVFEINNDAKMKRTRQRPLPSGRLSTSHAVMWASSIGAVGTTLLAWKANALAAGLAASNLALYAFVYTPLKQIHPANTWVGAVVGAIPPLLGWAAASGSVSLNGMILPAALYFWQIPHFMALAYLCRNDYAAGGFKMFSLADASGQRTALVALRNCLYLLPLGFLAYDWGIASEWFCIESTLFTLFMSATALSFVRDRTSKNARQMFHASLLYLPVFMAGLLLHRHPNNEQKLAVGDSDGFLELPFSPEIEEVQEREKRSHQNKLKKSCVEMQSRRPPVAYASVAPFPFLPAPLYVSPDQ